jgi:uncharacterized protein YqjF (DUF2071 family)
MQTHLNVQNEADSSSLLAARMAKPAGLHVMHQRWEHLLFLHWMVDPVRIQSTLPVELTVHTFDGTAYLGIIPFFMKNVRAVGAPPLPWLSNFQELNVRTYVFDRAGRPGVWFYSLDCNRVWATLGARLWTGLPYFWAEMEARGEGLIVYRSRRRGSSAWAQYKYRGTSPDRETVANTLEFFLLERYFLYSRRTPAGPLFREHVSHEPYRYRAVEVVECSTLPAQLDGFKELRPQPDHACLVDGFDVRIYPPQEIE